MQKLAVLLPLFLTSLLSSPVFAQQIVSPDWSSDRVLELRTQSDNDAIVFNLKSRKKPENKPETVKSSVVRLWSDFDQVSNGEIEIVTDYRLCRVFSWNDKQAIFDNHSCYAGPAFRKIELRNRFYLNDIMKDLGAPDKAKLAVEDPFWIEQEFATQNKASNPLEMVKSEDGIEWRLGDEAAIRASLAGLSFSQKDRQKFARYFARYINIHPQVRRDILDSGKIPQRIEIKRRALDGRSKEILTFSSMQNAKIEFPLPANRTSNIVVRSKEDSIKARGLNQALNAIAGNIQPSGNSFDELFDRLEDAAKRKKPLETTLTFMEFTQLHGGAIMAEPDKLERVRGIMPIVRPLMESDEAADFMRASNFAGKKGAQPEREAAARYLANAENLDQMDFGTFRYVTFANLVRISEDTEKWDKEIFNKMPSLTDNYWKHIAAYPWASNAYKDLGDAWYRQFETFQAWESWDLGKAVDPDWQRGAMKSVADLEKRIRGAMPDSF